MSKKIVINHCGNCPHKDHKGAYGNPSYVPVCRSENKELGYLVEKNSKRAGSHAIYDGKIPKWCPLENNSAESQRVAHFECPPNSNIEEQLSKVSTSLNKLGRSITSHTIYMTDGLFVISIVHEKRSK